MSLTAGRNQTRWVLSTNMWDALQHLEDNGGTADRALFPHLSTLRALIDRGLVIRSPSNPGRYTITENGESALKYVRRRRGTVKNGEVEAAIETLSPNMVDELLSIHRREQGAVAHLATVKALYARSLITPLSGSTYARRTWTPTLYGKEVIAALEAMQDGN